MDYKIAGISLYYIISWFFIYSFLGWIWESAYVSVKKRKLVNRGFINGPLCTIYGAGAMFVYLLLRPVQGNPVLLYVGGVVLATLLEYITGWLMEHIFHTRWWDYSSKKYNLHGYICLSSSLAWGGFTLLLFYVLQPFVSWITGLYPVRIGKIIDGIIAVLYAADFTVSASAAFGLSKTFEKAEDMLEELVLYIQSTKLYETREEIRGKLETLPGYIRYQDTRERLGMKKQELLERFEARRKEGLLPDWESHGKMKQELEQRMDEFTEKWIELRKKQNVIKKRMVYAYPDLKKHFLRYREKHQEKKTKGE